MSLLKITDLEDGRKLDGDSKEALLPPEDFDFDKFKRGRLFFRDNIFSCTLAMYFSLIIGLSIPTLQNALVFTQQSHTPEKAFRRYLKTFQHVSLWHYDDVWDQESASHKSIQYVREMHVKVREQMHQNSSDTEHKFLSQFDMAVVQSGFVVLIILHPEVVGINCCLSDLDDYIYFWYGIGHLLGLSKKYNVCAYGLPQAKSFCKELEENVTKEYLVHPPLNFFPMLHAITMAFNPLRKWMHIITLAVILKLLSFPYHYEWMSFSTCDHLRYFIWRFIFFMMKNCEKFKFIINKKFEQQFKLKYID